jgi:hypothetical protein
MLYSKRKGILSSELVTPILFPADYHLPPPQDPLLPLDCHSCSVHIVGVCRSSSKFVDLARHLVIADLHRLAGNLSAFIVVTNSDAALAAEALGPEAFD